MNSSSNVSNRVPAAAASRPAVSERPSVRSLTNQSSSTFASLGLSAALLRAVTAEGYTHPTPIQSRCIPSALAGRDVLGCAQTGTGKTAAFVLPILQNLAARARTGGIRALILAPTRELAAQIGERAGAYGANLGLKNCVIYGGVGQRSQEIALAAKPDIVIATPGRLLDLMEQGYVRLDAVEVFVLDEADRMLDMGFIHDVKRVVRMLPTKRQTLFFSATMPPVIADLAGRILESPVRVEVVPQATTAEKIEQTVHHVAKNDKRALLEKVLKAAGVDRALVFTRTKRGANRLVEQLERAGITSAAIHGNKSQGARERALEGFRRGNVPVLIATDIAARGIDVDGITHVVNYDLPEVPEQYVHRIGRTARAGARGRAIAFCDEDERGLLADIERTIRQRIPVAERVEIPPSAPTADHAERREWVGGRQGRSSTAPSGRDASRGYDGRSRGDFAKASNGAASGQRPRTEVSPAVSTPPGRRPRIDPKSGPTGTALGRADLPAPHAAARRPRLDSPAVSTGTTLGRDDARPPRARRRRRSRSARPQSGN